MSPMGAIPVLGMVTPRPPAQTVHGHNPIPVITPILGDGHHSITLLAAPWPRPPLYPVLATFHLGVGHATSTVTIPLR